MDLSLSSLSFAKRKMQELNHSNVEFLHGDILNLKNLNRKFSVIECVGVLHHLKDPEEGLKILLSILEPNVYLKIGLYSEFARKHIVETRQFIKKKNIESNILNIRRIRENINNNYILQEEQWNFFVTKLQFCKRILKSLNIDESYKKILLHNLKKDFEYFRI